MPQIARHRRFLSYDEISQWIDAIAPELQAGNYAGIVAVLRGGIFPAQCAAFATGVPLSFLRYGRRDQQATWVGSPPPPGRVLICEDVAGCGLTLVNAVRQVAGTHPEYDVLTIVSDGLSRLRPRWSMVLPGVQTVFPWERHDQTPRHQRDWHAGGAMGSLTMRADHDYRFWGVDLDGVLCEDLAPADYALDLEACLARRDSIPLAVRAPRLSPASHVIVTGRPIQDAERTSAWLATHGIRDVQVRFRDPSTHGSSIDAVAAHKGQTADALGCSDFIESCAHQATLIALGWPHMRVYWWRGGAPVLVSAVAAAVDAAVDAAVCPTPGDLG